MKTFIGFIGGFGWGILAATALGGLAFSQKEEEQNRETEAIKRKWFRDRTILRLMEDGRTYEEARAEFLRLFGKVRIIKEKSDD